MRRRLFAVGALGLGCGISAATVKPSYLAASQPQPRGTAIVTGGSRGIGAACSAALASKGYDVVVVYRAGAQEAREVVAGITSSGGRAVAMQADVSDESQVMKLFAEADRKEVAAFFRLGAVERLSPEEQEKHRPHAIGPRPVRTIKNEKELKVNPEAEEG